MINFHIRRLDHTNIRWDLIPGFEHNKITENKIFRIHVSEDTSAANDFAGRGRDETVAEVFQCLGTLCFHVRTESVWAVAVQTILNFFWGKAGGENNITVVVVVDASGIALREFCASQLVIIRLGDLVAHTFLFYFYEKNAFFSIKYRN
eukprot:PhM_4_TR5799/c0_g2_i1/m.26960